MTDYRPLDLSALSNAGVDALVEHAAVGFVKPPRDLTQPSAYDPQSPQSTPRIGRQMFQGLPFQIGGRPASEDSCYLLLGAGPGTDTASVKVDCKARHIIFVHRLLDSEIENGGPLGVHVADYVVHLEGGESVTVPIRERFEISIVPPAWGGLPYRAVSDEKNSLPPRYVGAWEQAGRRQTEALRGAALDYFLWAWVNPHPDKTIEAIELVAKGPRFIVAGITLGHLDEHPFVRAGARELKIVLPNPEEASKPFTTEVEVDRGYATLPYPLPAVPAEEFLDDDFKGWGEERNNTSSPAYVEVAATRSATVTVKQDGESLGSAQWGEVEDKKVVQPNSKLRLELIDRGRNWVHTTVLDDDSGQPVPCRIHFRSIDGVPYQPHGHHSHVNSDMGTWHMDVGGDLRLGQATYAYIDGKCQGWLPRGDVIVDVARGFEYEPLRTRINIKPGQRELVLRIRRWRDMNKERWFSGDSHVHFLSTQGSHAESQGEDLNVVNLLQSQWGSLFTNVEEFVGGPSVSSDGRNIVYVTQENRQHFLGHLILLGLKNPVMPWCSDGPDEAALGGTLEVTMSDWADQCHSQGGTVIIPHHPNPNGEPAALIATGRADAVEMLRHTPYNHLEYYRYLNGGYRLPLVGGTDKMSSDVPVGLYRTYVNIPPDEEFTYDSWCRNLTKGRTFLSGGPLINLSVEGYQIGDTIMLPGNGGRLNVEATAESIFPIHRLEIIQQGRVVASTDDSNGAQTLRIRANVTVSGDTWVAARVSGPNYMQPPRHHDLWSRGVFAHTSPIYIACGAEWRPFDMDTAQYMLTLVDGTLTYIRESSAQHQNGAVTHHHGEDDHLAYLERPFLEARDEIMRRISESAG